MKVWEKIAHDNNLKNKDVVRAAIKSNCPAGIESQHHYIGESKLKNFCSKGCSVICTDEYLDLRVKRGINNGRGLV